MAINFPTGLDSLTRYIDGTTVMIASTLNNMQLAIEANQVKIGIDSSAVATSHDYKIAQIEAGVVNASGATVFNSSMTAGDTFQDLDLSGTVGSNYAIVWLEVKLDGNADPGEEYIAKTKGYGSATFAEHNGSQRQFGGCVLESDGLNAYAQMCLPTDTNGVIQHGFSNNADTVLVKLIAWIK